MQVNRPSTPPSEPPSRGPATGVPGAYKWWVVFMLWFVCFFNYADRQAIFASLFDAIEPKARGTAAGLMNTVGWGGGALGPVFVGWSSKYGSRPTEVENMSDAIAFGGIIYLVAAGLVVAAMLLFARQGRRAQSR